MLPKGPQTALELSGRSPHSRGILTRCLGPVTVVAVVVLSGSMIRDSRISQPCNDQGDAASRCLLVFLAIWGSKHATGRAGRRRDLGDAAANDDFCLPHASHSGSCSRSPSASTNLHLSTTPRLVEQPSALKTPARRCGGPRRPHSNGTPRDSDGRIRKTKVAV